MVYVDPIARHPSGLWCHMAADTHEELEDMARQLGLKPEWIQKAGTCYEHYDLVPSKRAQAVKLGAVECSTPRDFFLRVIAPKKNKVLTIDSVRE